MRIVDLTGVVMGPFASQILADFGADVIKVERPGSGDGTRAMFRRDPADDVTYFWKLLGRGKRAIVLDLKCDEGRRRMLDLCASADVLIENFRPGTLERLGLGPEVLHERNPDLVITRVTGFGQDGPYAGRAGFATLAEAMSGLASLSGEPAGPPLLPPIALTDEVTGLTAAFATMVAVHSGVGQVVDVNLLESLLQIMGPLVSAAAVEGWEQPRLGSGVPYTVPRGTWQCRDGGWVAVSTSAESVARRVLALVGLGDDESLRSFDGRVAARERIDTRMAEWIGERTRDEVVAAFAEAEAACAPVYSMNEVLADPHVQARGSVAEIDGTPMQGLVARLSATPGRIRWAGRPLGADTDEVLAELDERTDPT
ncbi:MAG TPA: CoA transferase [Acidimicrobiales bacterium]